VERARLGRPTLAVTPDQYKPYEFLIGSWDFGQPGQARQRHYGFSSGGRTGTYIQYAARTRNAMGELTPHFQGIIVWNGLHGEPRYARDARYGETAGRRRLVPLQSSPTASVLREIFATASKTTMTPAAVRPLPNTFTLTAPRSRWRCARDEDGGGKRIPAATTL